MFPRNFDPHNHAARRWLRRIGPESYRQKPAEPIEDDLAPELETPMPSPLQREEPVPKEEPKPLWEREQDARWRELL